MSKDIRDFPFETTKFWTDAEIDQLAATIAAQRALHVHAYTERQSGTARIRVFECNCGERREVKW